METRNDKVKIAILKYVNENPGTSFNNMHRALESKAAKATIAIKRKQLEDKGLLRVERGERKGQKSKHYLTDVGAHFLVQTPMALSTTGALLKIGFSQAFLNNLGQKGARRFLFLINDKEESKRVAFLVAAQINLYAESIDKPAWAVEYMESLNRHFFVGSLPTEISRLIKQKIEADVFSKDMEAFSLFFNVGIDVFMAMLKGGLDKVTDKPLTIRTLVKYDTQKAQYVVRAYREEH